MGDVEWSDRFTIIASEPFHVAVTNNYFVTNVTFGDRSRSSVVISNNERQVCLLALIGGFGHLVSTY